jgi:hypothetical protein
MHRLRSLDKTTRELRSILSCVIEAIGCIERLGNSPSLSRVLADLRLEMQEVDREIAALKRKRDASGPRLVRKRSGYRRIS